MSQTPPQKGDQKHCGATFEHRPISLHRAACHSWTCSETHMYVQGATDLLAVLVSTCRLSVVPYGMHFPSDSGVCLHVEWQSILCSTDGGRHSSSTCVSRIENQKPQTQPLDTQEHTSRRCFFTLLLISFITH